MICPICHKKVNRINSCRIIAASGTLKSKSKRTCQSCAEQLFKLVCDGLLDKSFIAPTQETIKCIQYCMKTDISDDDIKRILEVKKETFDKGDLHTFTPHQLK